jgi:dipeptidyl aminopeptidase/acylaminoacyl peptidase
VRFGSLAALTAVVAISAVGAQAGSSARVYYADPAWSRDGKQIAFVERASGRLYVARANGSGVRRVPIRARAASPAWSPDGRSLAYREGRAGIAIVDLDGRRDRRLTAAGSSPDWSPGGRVIAYSAFARSSAIYTISARGTARRLVARTTRIGQALAMPSWSPDGKRIALCVCIASGARAPLPRTSLGIVSARGGRIARVAARRLPLDPDWSPAGGTIAFSDANNEIIVFDLHSRRSLELHAGQHPRWSPNGRRILYADSGVICLMNANGSHAHVLIRGGSPSLSHPCTS